MTGKSGAASPSKKVQRESDNPILEEYKEDLSHRPGYGVHTMSKDSERLSRLERLLSEMEVKIASLEKRVKELEK